MLSWQWFVLQLKVLIALVAVSFAFLLLSSRAMCIRNVFRTFRCCKRLEVIGILGVIVSSRY
jgi:hypothetical protein